MSPCSCFVFLLLKTGSWESTSWRRAPFLGRRVQVFHREWPGAGVAGIDGCDGSQLLQRRGAAPWVSGSLSLCTGLSWWHAGRAGRSSTWSSPKALYRVAVALSPRAHAAAPRLAPGSGRPSSPLPASAGAAGAPCQQQGLLWRAVPGWVDVFPPVRSSAASGVQGSPYGARGSVPWGASWHWAGGRPSLSPSPELAPGCSAAFGGFRSVRLHFIPFFSIKQTTLFFFFPFPPPKETFRREQKKNLEKEEREKSDANTSGLQEWWLSRRFWRELFFYWVSDSKLSVISHVGITILTFTEVK